MASSSGSPMPITVGILTVSDRCHAGVMTDTSGPNLSHLVQTLLNNGVVAEVAIVPDEEKDIKDKLLQWCDTDHLNVIFTSGGTGFAQRDITPEVTKSIIHKEAPGMMVAMLKASLDVTPMAMLSRPVCGIRDKTVIINLPGSKKGSEECFRFVLPALTHAVNLVRGDNQNVTKTHEVVQAGIQNTPDGTIEAGSIEITPADVIHIEDDHTDTTQDLQESPGFEDPNIEHGAGYDLQQNLSFMGPPFSYPAVYSVNSNTAVTGSVSNQVTEGQGFHVHKMPRTQAQKKLYTVPYANFGDMIIDPSNCVSESSGHSSGYNINENGMASAQTMIAYPSQEVVMLENTASENDCVEEDAGQLDKVTEHLEEVEEEISEENEDNVQNCAGNRDILDTDATNVNHNNSTNDKEDNEISASVNKDAEIITECAQALFEMSQQGNTDITVNNGKSNKQKDKTGDIETADGNEETTTNDAESGDKVDDTHKKKYRVLSTKPKRHYRDAEVCFAQVGASAKIWTLKHPQINGIYLNKGKREIKKHLVQLKRQPTAVDKSSYLRNGKVNDRNRIDDYFEFTDAGKEKREKFEEGLVRDEYVVNWYMWCPGHYNCLRQCGGYGKCLEGCSGSKHKQDRHNCSLMINWKLYLSDLERWMIQITGSHVPVGSSVQWTVPATNKDRLDEDTRDLILKYSEKSAPNSKIEELIAKQIPSSTVRKPPTSKQISRFMFNRKRKRLRSHHQYYTESLGNDEDTRNYSEEHKGQETDKTSTERHNLVNDAEENVAEEASTNENTIIMVDEQDNFNAASSLPEEVVSSGMSLNTACSEMVQSGTENSGYVYTYFEQPNLPTVYNTGANFVNTSQDHGVFSLYTGQKVDNQNVNSVLMDQQQFNQLPSNIQFQTNTMDASQNEFTQLIPNSCATNNMAVGGSDITSVLTNQCVPQLGQESSLTGTQPVQIISQLPSSLSQVQVIPLDTEGQPMYRNYGDIQSLIPAYQQPSTI